MPQVHRSGACMTLALVVLFCLPTQAWGFSRSRDPKGGICLWWPKRVVVYYLNEDCSADFSIDQREICYQTVEDSFQVWTDVDCSDFEFLYAGVTSRDDVGYDPENKFNNINLVVWRDFDWEYDPSAIALTTTTYDTITGVIVDSDVEFNGVYFTFTAADSHETRTDVQNTLVHEAGHVLGLDHSHDSTASMFATAFPSELNKRDLAEDDQDGICFVYPIGEVTPPFFPIAGELIPCGLDDIVGNGWIWGCGMGGRFSSAAIWVLSCLLLWFCWRARARRVESVHDDVQKQRSGSHRNQGG